MKRVLVLLAVTLPLVLTVSLGSGAAVGADDYPTTLRLPKGWLPEGVVIGYGEELYAGSRRTGAIYAFNLQTGAGSVRVPGREGGYAVGLSFDVRTNYIFAAGGPNGDLNVYDAGSGRSAGSYKLAAGSGGTFVNDVIVTRDAAYLTDSQRPVLYRVPLGPNGELPGAADVKAIPLWGDYAHQSGFNVNGIEATASGDRLIIVQSNTNRLFVVEPSTGAATRIDLVGGTLSGGDGLLLEGRVLYVVQNANAVVRIELAPNYLSGRVVDTFSHPDFESPTTIARAGSRVYVVNGRFRSGDAPTLSYSITGFDRWPTAAE